MKKQNSRIKANPEISTHLFIDHSNAKSYLSFTYIYIYVRYLHKTDIFPHQMVAAKLEVTGSQNKQNSWP